MSTSNGEAATNSSQRLGTEVNKYINANSIAASDHNISEQAIALVIRLPHTAENTISTIDETNAAATKQRYSCDKSGI